MTSQVAPGAVSIDRLLGLLRIRSVCLISLLTLFSFVVLASQTTDTGQAVALEPNKPIERELSSGGVHYYVLSVRAGQFCRVIVDQRGIDVVVRLISSDGRKLLEVDSPDERNGPEHVSLVADSDASYRIEVRSTDKDAPKGRYQVSIDELRTAAPEDKVRVAAEGAFSEGIQLEGEQTGQSTRSAIVKFQESLPLWKSLGDIPGQVNALDSLGRCYLTLGELRKSLDFYEQSLQLVLLTSDRNRQAQILDRVATVYDSLGEKSKALDFFDRSLQLRRAVGDPDGIAAELNNMGLAYVNAGESQKALDLFSEALPIYKKLVNRAAEATLLNNIAMTYGYLGEYQKALDIFLEALPIHRSVNSRQMEATTFNNMGVISLRMGNQQKALENFSQALPIYESLGNVRDQGMTLTNIGQSRNELHDYRNSLTYLNRALEIHRTGGNRRAEAATLNNIGIADANLGDLQAALECYNKSLEISRSIGDRQTEAATLYHLARFEREKGNLIDARARIEESLAAVESLRADVTSQQLRASYFASVRKYHDFQINVLMRLHKQRPTEGFDAIALEASERGRARSLLELLKLARAGNQSDVDPPLLERERTLRQLLSDRATRQMRMLSGKHTEEQAAQAAKELDTLTTEYDQLQSRIRQANPRYAALTQPAPLTSATIREKLLDRDTVLLEFALGDEASYVWAVTPTSVKGFELPARVEVEAAARRFYESVTARNDVVPGESQAQRATRLQAAERDFAQHSLALSQMLLSPISANLQDADGKRIAIVSDGMLQYIPFAALPFPAPQTASSTPLIVKHEVITLPSASVLAELRSDTAQRQAVSKTVAVLADPVFDAGDARISSSARTESVSPANDKSAVEVRRSATESGVASFERLRFSRQEAENIAALAPAGKKLEALDFAATRALATSPDLSDYRIIHFATHGLINSQHPELSGVVLSLVDQQGRTQDGFLRLYEIYNLKLRAELVVLSACQTALGKEVKGEGLVGLTRGFMYAGVPRVIASLWRIDDRASAELMKRFYQLMLGKGMAPAAALRAAQISMLREQRWQAPYYWAGFTLQGEWK